MHKHSLESWQHSHDFSADTGSAERRTSMVMALTAVVMVIEIIAGSVYGSMALLADGWHMATHVAAFGIAVFAYRYARRHADNPRFSFGTGKVSVLGGFASAVALAVVALFMVMESLLRLVNPEQIRFDEAILVAVIGLIVNIVSGFMLKDHDHDHDHHGHGHEDHNLRAAYFHVLADALTSVFAIVALTLGKYFGWTSLDPVMGIVGAIVITRWAWGLLRDTSDILLDGSDDSKTTAAIKQAIEGDADSSIVDLHVWVVGPGYYAATVAVVTHHPRPPQHYKGLLADIPRLAHITIEVNECRGEPC